MAGVAEKLYPPVIGGSIPAFYQENGTAIIAVPFSMNRAVDTSRIGGFRLKIKTVQSNTFIKQLDLLGEANVINAITNRVVKFEWSGFDPSSGNNGTNDSNKIKIGQYLKVQLAYVEKSSAQNSLAGAVGYFSTVGITKFTSKPNVFINGLGENINQIATFKTTYTGVYEPTEDKSERPYYYNFFLFDAAGETVETSGWKIHNTSINTIASESLSLSRTTDTYSFDTLLDPNEEYHVQYGVRTINNLEIFSPLYSCIEPYSGESNFWVGLAAENIFEEGYIQLRLYMQPGHDVDTEELANPVSLEFCRSEKTDNYSSWQVLNRMYFTSYTRALEWGFKDFTIEQGITYKYCFRQYTQNGVQSARVFSEEVFADFEDMFLWDGRKQLKIRFNPKVSSFKTTRLEQKMDTIGSRFPFIFRNGVVEYKEFPIAGLISYLADNNEMFVNREEDLNILSEITGAERLNSPVHQDEEDTSLGKSWEVSQTLNSTGYNMRTERRFKMKLLEWLGNGKIKMFKSPAEGNYLVRLMNISLTPEDKIGRMLHNFSCTAYEVEELTYNNLVSLGFLDPSDDEKTGWQMETIKFRDKVHTLRSNTGSVKLNDHTIQSYLYVQLSPNVESGAAMFLRVGGNSVDNRTYVHNSFIIEDANAQLPDVYFSISDNVDLIREKLGYDSNHTVTVADAESFVADAEITYKYYRTDVAIGDFQNISNVYIRNEVETFIGPNTYNFNLSIAGQTPSVREVLKFFVLNIKKKTVRKIYYSSGTYTDESNNVLTTYDDLCTYEVYNKSNNTLRGTYISQNHALVSATIDYSVILEDENNFISSFSEPPLLNLSEHLYRRITLGNGVYAECAYQVKITEYNNVSG